MRFEMTSQNVIAILEILELAIITLKNTTAGMQNTIFSDKIKTILRKIYTYGGEAFDSRKQLGLRLKKIEDKLADVMKDG
jgi:hypothetical protein